MAIGRFVTLNCEKLRNLSLPEIPLREQRRIVAYLDDLQKHADTLKSLQSETAKELDALMPSILDKAFRVGWLVGYGR